jgi:predicted naringenin-chalcone synthase
MSLAIASVGTAVPTTRLTQAEAMAVARAVCCRSEEQASWLPDLYGGSGIESRYLAFDYAVVQDILKGTRHSRSPFLPGEGNSKSGPTSGERMRHYREQAPSLATRAASQALMRADMHPGAISHLITVTCTGFFAPGLDVALIKALGLQPHVARTQIGFMGCHGALNGLRVADAFARSNPGTRILLCAVELCGLHYNYGWDPQLMVANALFADGAAALVGRHAAGATSEAWRLVASGSCVIPDSEDAMTWIIGDHNFEMTLSKQVPGLIARNLRPWLSTWLKELDLDVTGIASWAVHPGGPRILKAVEEALALNRQALADSRTVLAEYGNMSSPTLLFILDRLRQRSAPRPCVALGFGPGLVVEAALFR